MGLLKNRYGKTISSRALDGTLKKVHPDLRELLFFADGDNKNYSKELNGKTVRIKNVDFEIKVNKNEEASLIYTKLPVGQIPIDSETLNSIIIAPGTSYKKMTPEQRGKFWAMLEDPYRMYFDINYLMLLLGCLERHLIMEDYEKAFDVIIKMRFCFPGEKFQRCSANALLMTCIYWNRADLLDRFYESMDIDHDYYMSNDLYIFASFALRGRLKRREAMRFARDFRLDDTQYMRLYVDIFDKYLKKNIENVYGEEEFIFDKLLDEEEYKKARSVSADVFTNNCFDNKRFTFPKLSSTSKLNKGINDMLLAAHNNVIEDIEDLLARGLLINPFEATRHKVRANKTWEELG